MKHIITIQRYYRNYRCKKKIKKFTKLPSDIWNIILDKIVTQSDLDITINRIFFKRLVLMLWTPPFKKIQFKLRTLNIISSNPFYFTRTTCIISQVLCHRLLQHSSRYTCILYINSFLEKFLKHNLLC